MGTFPGVTGNTKGEFKCVCGAEALIEDAGELLCYDKAKLRLTGRKEGEKAV
jgi:hypothetical protein